MPQLYTSCVPSEADNCSDTMANSDGVSDRGTTKGRSGRNTSRRPTTNTELREYLVHLEQKIATMNVRIDQQDLIIKAQHHGDVSLLQNISASTKASIAAAFKGAADEQHCLGDFLAQKAASILGSSTPKSEIHQPSHHATTTSQYKHTGCQTEAPDTETTRDHTWLPKAIRELTPAHVNIKTSDIEPLPYDTIVDWLSGVLWSPGFYYAFFPNLDPALDKCASFWMLELDNDPFVPHAPGMHGAKLTPLIRPSTNPDDEPNDQDYINVPVFVALRGNDEYTYMGHYSQCRFSDKLDSDSLAHVPPEILNHWAEQLTDPERPDWVTQELMQHFWPKPQYNGPLPTSPTSSPMGRQSSSRDAQLGLKVEESLTKFAHEVKAWDRDARMRVSMLTPTLLMDAFQQADTATKDGPGLRLYWEYLAFVRWDHAFHARLIEFKHGLMDRERRRSKKKGKMKRPDAADDRSNRDASITTSMAKNKQPASAPLQQGHSKGQTQAFPEATPVPTPKQASVEAKGRGSSREGLRLATRTPKQTPAQVAAKAGSYVLPHLRDRQA